jgi:hypothetical protein
MSYLFGEVQSLHGFVKKSGRKIRAQLIFPGLKKQRGKLPEILSADMEEEKSKAIYNKRKVIVEPVFGQIKNSGFQGFSVRGKEKVTGEFSLVCATHNIKK